MTSISRGPRYVPLMLQARRQSEHLGRVLINRSDLINVRFDPVCGLRSDITRGPRSATTGPMHCTNGIFIRSDVERNHQYELSPLDIPAMADGSPHLF